MSKLGQSARAILGSPLMQISFFLMMVSAIHFFAVPLLWVMLTAVVLAPFGLAAFWYFNQQRPAAEQARSGLFFSLGVVWLVFVLLVVMRWPR